MRILVTLTAAALLSAPLSAGVPERPAGTGLSQTETAAPGQIGAAALMPVAGDMIEIEVAREDLEECEATLAQVLSMPKDASAAEILAADPMPQARCVAM